MRRRAARPASTTCCAAWRSESGTSGEERVTREIDVAERRVLLRRHTPRSPFPAPSRSSFLSTRSSPYDYSLRLVQLRHLQEGPQVARTLRRRVRLRRLP